MAESPAASSVCFALVDDEDDVEDDDEPENESFLELLLLVELDEADTDRRFRRFPMFSGDDSRSDMSNESTVIRVVVAACCSFAEDSGLFLLLVSILFFLARVRALINKR